MKLLLIFFVLIAGLSLARGETCTCARSTVPTCTGIVYEDEGRCSSPTLTNCQQCYCDQFGFEECEIFPSQNYKYNGTEDFCSLVQLDEVKCPPGPQLNVPSIAAQNLTFCCGFSGQGSMTDFSLCELPSWQSQPESSHPYASLNAIYRTLITDVVLDLSYNASTASLTWSYNSNFNFTYRLTPGLPQLFSFYHNPTQDGIALNVVVPPAWTQRVTYNLMHELAPLLPGNPTFATLEAWPQPTTVYEMIYRATVATLASSAQRIATYNVSACVTYQYDDAIPG